MIRVLVMGGSWFLGRAVVDEALSRGCDVATFRRGRSGHASTDVALIRGDRTNSDDLVRLADAGPWDAVIDTSGYVPREMLAVARTLEPVARRYIFVSTVSVYRGWPVERLTEESPILDCQPDAGPDYGYDGDPGPSVYGFTKAGCERAVLDVFGASRTVLLRPGVILGPREYVGRLPWWLRRMERGGQILAPGRPDRSIQPVDVRDVASFALRGVTGQAGTFNVTAPGHESMRDFLVACKETVSSDVNFKWVTDEQWLAAQGVAQWTELPLWRTYEGVWAVNSARARDAGLTTRRLRETVADTWTWMHTTEGVVSHERASEQGISADKEAAILGMWAAREADRCGA